jgi:hypothetical protein
MRPSNGVARFTGLTAAAVLQTLVSIFDVIIESHKLIVFVVY